MLSQLHGGPFVELLDRATAGLDGRLRAFVYWQLLEHPKPKLNPRFVEWLMGMPIGWTDCGALGMQSFRSWRHAHLFSLRRGLESEADQ